MQRQMYGEEAVYETSSMCLVFQAPYEVYSKFVGIPGIHLICETRKDNFLKKIAASTLFAPSSRDPDIALRGPRPSGAENTRPNR